MEQRLPEKLGERIVPKPHLRQFLNLFAPDENPEKLTQGPLTSPYYDLYFASKQTPLEFNNNILFLPTGIKFILPKDNDFPGIKAIRNMNLKTPKIQQDTFFLNENTYDLLHYGVRFTPQTEPHGVNAQANGLKFYIPTHTDPDISNTIESNGLKKEIERILFSYSVCINEDTPLIVRGTMGLPKGITYKFKT